MYMKLFRFHCRGRKPGAHVSRIKHSKRLVNHKSVTASNPQQNLWSIFTQKETKWYSTSVWLIQPAPSKWELWTNLKLKKKKVTKAKIYRTPYKSGARSHWLKIEKNTRFEPWGSYTLVIPLSWQRFKIPPVAYSGYINSQLYRTEHKHPNALLADSNVTLLRAFWRPLRGTWEGGSLSRQAPHGKHTSVPQ